MSVQMKRVVLPLVIIAVASIALLAFSAVHVRKYSPIKVREMIMEERFGFLHYFSDLPPFQVANYKTRKVDYGRRFGSQSNLLLYLSDYNTSHEYTLRFAEPLGDAILAKMDSLIANETPLLSGWRFNCTRQEYYYYFDDIGRNVKDTLFFSKDGKNARLVSVY